MQNLIISFLRSKNAFRGGFKSIFRPTDSGKRFPSVTTSTGASVEAVEFSGQREYVHNVVSGGVKNAPHFEKGVVFSMRKSFSVFCLLGLMLLSALAPAQAQVSLKATDQTEVAVNVDGKNESFTILRHFARPEQFYYVANRPQLATRGNGDKKWPVFHLLRYQTKDHQTNDIVQSGIMQFALRLAPAYEVVSEIRKQVAAKFSLPEPTVKVAPLPFKSAEIALYDQEGNLIAVSFQKPGIAPNFARKEIPFHIPVTKVRPDFFSALTSGSGGIPVCVTYTFDTVSPVTDFKVTIDWDRSFSYFDKDERTRTAFPRWYYYRTWRGGRRQAQEQTLAEVLTENKSISYESVGMTPEQISKYLDPFIERLTREMIEKITPPQKIEPAAAKEPNSAWWNARSTYSMYSVNRVKKGKEVFEMRKRDIVESKSTNGAMLGISQYDETIRRQLITTMPVDKWNHAYFPLPAVGDSEALAIKKIDLQVIPRFFDKSGKARQIPGTVAELAVWKPQDGFFSDRKGNEITNILFPMQAISDSLAQNSISLSSCAFEVVSSIIQGSNIIKFSSLEKFHLGDVPVSTPMARIEGVKVDCESLTFDKDGLYAVKIEIKPTFPSKAYSSIIKADTAIKCLVFPVEKEDEGKKNKITAQISFVLKGGKQVSWKHNGRNLQDADLGLSLTLWDEDYRPEQY
jgi:hypothetical protein